LIRILDSGVKIADLVVEHLLEVGFMEVLSDSLSEGNRKEFGEVVKT
jgi:hypothetical protein